MYDFIRLEGPQRAVYLFDTRLVGVNAEQGKKLLLYLEDVLEDDLGIPGSQAVG